MSIPIAVPAASNPDPNIVALATSLAAVLSSPPPIQSALQTVLTDSSAANQAPSVAATSGLGSSLDPLTPRSTTAASTAALTSVISNVQSTLADARQSSVHGSGTFTQFVSSPAFQQALQVLSATGTSSQSPSPPVSSNLANLNLIPSNETPAIARVSTTTVASSTSDSPGSSSGEAMPYFQKLLGELESTYQSSGSSGTVAGTSMSGISDFDSSELDLFLKWLSLNGGGSVAANA